MHANTIKACRQPSLNPRSMFISSCRSVRREKYETTEWAPNRRDGRGAAVAIDKSNHIKLGSGVINGGQNSFSRPVFLPAEDALPRSIKV
jgi:hypothetical protein